MALAGGKKTDMMSRTKESERPANLSLKTRDALLRRFDGVTQGDDQ
jgi:hypothetical protein